MTKIKVRNSVNFVRWLAIVVLATACGSSSSSTPPTPQPSATPTRTKAPEPTPTAAPQGRAYCADGLSSFSLTGLGDTFLAAITRRFDGSRARAEAIRFHSDGSRIDNEPLVLNDAEELESSFSANGAVATDNEFHVGLFGDVLFAGGAYQSRVEHRAVPASGPLASETVLDAANTPGGVCRTYLTSANGIVSNLSGTDVHRTLGWSAACAGESEISWFEGLPGAPSAPGGVLPGQFPVTTIGRPALARGENEVAGVYITRGLYGGVGSPPENRLAAGWIEAKETPAAPAQGEHLLLTELEDTVSLSPALAAAGETFLAAWASAPAGGGDATTEIRLMRFDATRGPLDPEGGIVVSSASGNVQGLRVASDGRHFRLLWGETDEDQLLLRTQLFDQDGKPNPVEPEPVSVLTMRAGEAFDLAVTDEATLIGYLAPDEGDPNENCLHVLLLPVPLPD